MVVFSSTIMLFSRAARAAAAAAVRGGGGVIQRRKSYYYYSRSYSSSSSSSSSGGGIFFSTLPKQGSFSEENGGCPHNNLVLAINEEIKFRQVILGHHHRVEEEAPTGFPFKIEDNPGDQTITLTRDYQGGEVIKVTAHMPDEKDWLSRILLVVYVSNKDGGEPSLEFNVMAYTDRNEISIDSLSVKEPNASSSSSSSSEGQQIAAYEGLDFKEDSNENLRKAFHKSYLEMRGITPSTANFLHKYMIEKKNRDNLTWLNNFEEFIAS